MKRGKAKDKDNRRILVSFELQPLRQQANQNLLAEQGIASLALPVRASMRKKHSIEPETVFGDIKHNCGFRRFSLRGLKKWRLSGVSYPLLTIYENWQPDDCQFFFISFPLSTAFSYLFRRPHVCCRVKHYQDASTIATEILYKRFCHP
ncbi:MAG: transposase [Anaerolineales bacterium]